MFGQRNISAFGVRHAGAGDLMTWMRSRVATELALCGAAKLVRLCACVCVCACMFVVVAFVCL